MSQEPRYVFISSEDMGILCRAAYDAGALDTQEATDRFGRMQERVKALGGIPDRTVWLKCVSGVADGSQVLMEANLSSHPKEGWLKDIE